MTSQAKPQAKTFSIELTPQLLECTQGEEYRNRGCAGGWPSLNFMYIHDNGGLDTEESYPYRAGKCRHDVRHGCQMAIARCLDRMC